MGRDEFKAGEVQANGLHFHFIEQGAGPLILALHGFPDTPRTFRYQMRFLAEAGFRVVAPALRGYAPTDAPADGTYDGAALAQDTVALIEALTHERVILIGHDWGAIAAYNAAILAPARIARLITLAVPRGGAFQQAFLINPAQQRRWWYMWYFQMPWAEMAVAYDDFVFIERLWQEWSPGWTYPVDELEAVKATLRQPGVLTAALKYYQHTFNRAAAPPDAALDVIRERLAEPIHVPTLYLHGANDGAVGVECTEGMETAFAARFEKHVIADAGHFLHQERPDAINHVIREFLQSDERSKTPGISGR